VNTRLLLLPILLTIAATSCRHRDSSTPVVVHVLRDTSASFVKSLREADLQFTAIPRYLGDRQIVIATNEGNSFPLLLGRFPERTPDLLILESEADLSPNPSVKSQLGKPVQVCGQFPAFVPTPISGDQRDAAEMYLQFLASHCVAVSGTQSTASPQIAKHGPSHVGFADRNVLQELFPKSPRQADDCNCFRSLPAGVSMYGVVEKCGRPNEDAGSGIYIFIYQLRDGSTVTIGTPSLDRIDRITCVDASGKRTLFLPVQ
jgi:hypothetical protein